MNGRQDVALGFEPGDAVIVTGAGSGIGRCTAVNAAAIGLAVAAWDVDEERARDTVDAIRAAGGSALAIHADVTSTDQVTLAVAESAKLGSVRYLVNNAGPPSAATLEFAAALAMAVASVHDVTTAWMAAGTLDGAAVVNVASVAGNLLGVSPGWYSAAKAAIAGYTRHLAAARGESMRANAVAPGITDTPRLASFMKTPLAAQIRDRIPMRRFAAPDEISWTILFLLSPLASYVNGAMVTVDGGWTVAQ